MDKTCTKCGEVKAASAFNKNSKNDKRYKTVLKAWCRDCCSAANKAWAASPRGREILNSPERKRKAKDAVLRFNYGITMDEFEAIEETQGKKCASCGIAAKLVVDHDHETRIVRGLLCHGCNSSLGLLGEDPARIRALADYAEKC